MGDEYAMTWEENVLYEFYMQGRLKEEGDGPTPGIPGDVDADGKIGIGDVADLIDYILGNSDSSFILANADVDGDGKIGIADVAELIDILLGN